MDDIIKKAKSFSKPIFTKNKDKDGRDFYVAYSNREGACCISLKGKNVVVPGNVKIGMRMGDSRFGNEMIFELLRTGPIKINPKRTDIDTIEIYLPMTDGLKFLESAIAYFKKVYNKNTTDSCISPENTTYNM